MWPVMASRKAHDGSKMAVGRLKMGPRWLPNGPKMAPRWPQDAVKTIKNLRET